MSHLTESAIETFAIQVLELQGHTFIHGPDLGPDGVTPERRDYSDVLLIGRLEQALWQINPGIDTALLNEALCEVQRLYSSDLLPNNPPIQGESAGFLFNSETDARYPSADSAARGCWALRAGSFQ